MKEGVEQFLSGNRSGWSYLYSYPHKTAYRPFPEPIPLERLWARESKESLYLYAHIPFCASKCSFCNLFSLAHPGEGLVDRYLDRLELQAKSVRMAVGSARYAGYAVGGGTPSLLEVRQLERLLAVLGGVFGVDLSRAGSFEASPDTLDLDKIRLLSGVGLERLSLGVQTFDETESRLLGRPRPDGKLLSLLDAAASAGFPSFNLDLIYGIAGQTVGTFRASLERAVSYAPGEIFLYPLYVRPLTALHRRDPGFVREGERMDRLLEAGRQFLLENGYRQDSLRRFVLASSADAGPSEYACQEDGMVGLGVGARSYTRDVHYSTDWAVGRSEVEGILERFLSRAAADFACADHGIVLSLDDRKRRFMLKSLLKADGLDLVRYRDVFGSSASVDFPDLQRLERLELARCQEGRLRLTSRGMALSDGIGAWFIAPEVAERMREHAPR